jgi:DNA polymerase III psi subunit
VRKAKKTPIAGEEKLIIEAISSKIRVAVIKNAKISTRESTRDQIVDSLELTNEMIIIIPNRISRLIHSGTGVRKLFIKIVFNEFA